jgi:hypothetical protein
VEEFAFHCRRRIEKAQGADPRQWEMATTLFCDTGNGCLLLCDIANVSIFASFLRSLSARSADRWSLPSHARLDSPGIFKPILSQLDRHDTEQTKSMSSPWVIRQKQRCDGIQPQEEDFLMKLRGYGRSPYHRRI